MRHLRFLAVIVLLFGTLSTLSALELTQGRIKLVLSEDTGRFTLYYLQDEAKKTYVPLFFSDDPRTSGLTLLIGDRLYRMGDSSSFTMNLSKKENGAAFEWKSSNLVVTQSFSFTRSAGSAAANGVIISLDIENTGSEDVNVGARYLIDTTLGEHSSAHFRTRSEGAITHEMAIVPSADDPYVISEAGTSAPVGLEIMLFGSGLTTPDRAIVANWKRLNEAPWDFQVDTSRNFNLMPYSINDSAVMLYFKGQRLGSGQNRKIVIAMGEKNDAGFSAEPVSTTTAPPQQPSTAQSTQTQTQTTPEQQTPLEQPDTNVVNNAQTQALEQDYQTAQKLLDKINALLDAPPGTVDEAQLKSLEDQLSALESRKSQYSAP